MTRSTRLWLGAWIASVALLEIAAVVVDRRVHAISVAVIATDAYEGDPIAIEALTIRNRGGNPLQVRAVHVAWLGADHRVTVEREVAPKDEIDIQDLVTIALATPTEPGTYPFSLCRVEIAGAARGELGREGLAEPASAAVRVMPDPGPGDGFHDLLLATRRCGPTRVLAKESTLGGVATEAEREIARQRLADGAECLDLARAAARASKFTVPATHGASFPGPATRGWPDVGQWLMLAGWEAETRDDSGAAWTAYLDAWLLGHQIEAASWRQDSIANLLGARIHRRARVQLARLLDDGRIPPDLARTLGDSTGRMRALVSELSLAVGPAAFRVGQPDDVLQSLRYAPEALLRELVLRSMALASDEQLVRKRVASLLRTRALLARIEATARSTRTAHAEAVAAVTD